MPLRAAPLAVILLAGLAPGCSTRDDRPNVVLVVIDTLRADHLELYGHEHVTAPFLTRLAESGVVYERVVAPSSWTKTSMASLVTSRDPDRHGVRGPTHTLPKRLMTVAQAFADAGYRTVGINTNPWLEPRFGFDAGYEAYETNVFENARRTNRRALRQLDADDGRPVFLTVHYMDVHAPYTATIDAPLLQLPEVGLLENAQLERRYRKQGLDGPGVAERIHALYDAEIRVADRGLRRLVEALTERGFLDDAVLAVTADHGEAFREHGTTEHGRSLYPEVTAIPWVLWAPGRMPGGQRVKAQVRTIDVAPTLLALAGIEADPGFDGSSVVPADDGTVEDRTARSAVGLNDALPDEDWIGVFSEHFLYLRERRGDRVEFYDLRTDPGARHDLGRDHPAAAWHRAHEGEPDAGRPESIDLDAQLQQDLRALGYLDDGR